jgi:hypothetical protein
MTEHNLHFKTNVQLKSIIGKDLINDDNIAILELVKNSFDADSKRVDLTFENVKDNDDAKESNTFTNLTSRLLIHDDGVGMDLKDITDKWLNIAYSEKKTNSRQYNRLMAGAKGVGRFSCDRLGEYLNLYTKKSSSETYIKLFVDWKSFELDNEKDTEIQSIPISYEVLDASALLHNGIPLFDHGVCLEIIKLRSKWAYPKQGQNEVSWDTDKLTVLKKYLEKLINPNQAFIKDDFGIYILAPEFENENEILDDSSKFLGKVENRIFEKLDFRSTSIEAQIIDDGKVLYSELKDRGRTIFWLKEKNPFVETIDNAKLVVYYLNPYSKAFFTKQTGIRLLDYGSIFLFVNGFRVPPYGEQGNDWLLLDQRKGQGYARYLGSREVVGRIEILDAQTKFQIISSREGVVRNDSFKQLTNQQGGLFYKIFRRLEKYVVEGLNWDSIPNDESIGEIEKKIISGETQEQDLKYAEDETIKNNRVYDSIHAIISANPAEVIELYINENLILSKIAEQKEQSEKEFQQLLNDFENKNVDPRLLEQLLIKKARENKDVDKQLKEFSKYTTTEITSKAILEILSYKAVIDNQTKAINNLKGLLQKSEEEKRQTEEDAEKYKKEAEQAKEELKEIVSQNLFLKSIKSQDFDEVVSMLHHIGISASIIDNYLVGIYKMAESNTLNLSDAAVAEIFKLLIFENKKVLNISKFATKANFKLYTEAIELNIDEYIQEYVQNIVTSTLDSKINVAFNNENPAPFIFKFRPIEINILIDNLLSNAKKAGATNLSISLKRVEETFQMIFEDDGKGISTKQLESIFDFGFTTTKGSGIGLYHVKEIAQRLNADISVSSIPGKTIFIFSLKPIYDRKN